MAHFFLKRASTLKQKLVFSVKNIGQELKMKNDNLNEGRFEKLEGLCKVDQSQDISASKVDIASDDIL